MRDQLLALAHVRLGLLAQQERGVDDLPRAFATLVDLLAREVEQVDTDLARRLTPTLRALSG